MMSRKNSSAYAKSAFDAIGSTRKLSDELCVEESDVVYNNGVIDDVLERLAQHGHDTVRSNDNNNNEMDRDGDKDGGCNDRGGSDDNTQEGYTRKASSVSNDVGFTSSSLGSFAKESSSDPNEDNNNKWQVGDKDIEENEEEDEYDDDEEYNDDGKIDQRSESDSDLESPDDFDDNGNVYSRFKSLFKERNNDQDIHDYSLEDAIRNEIQENDPQQSTTDIEYITTEDNTAPKPHQLVKPSEHDIIASDTENPPHRNSSLQNPYSKLPEPAPTTNGTLNKDEHVLDNKADEPSSKEEADNNNADIIYGKFVNDKDVMDHSEKLDIVKDIGFGNMGQLQHLDRNDPALRRLFMRPRVSPVEAKSLKVDPDIKSMVNEFLRTNVAENFIIARVLRENYALFYAWLASHIQTERNSWVVRLSQALENADQERKGSLESRNLVVESATRLRDLVKNVSNCLYGIPGNQSEKTLFRKKGPSLRHGNVKAFRNVNGGGAAKRNTTNNNNNDDNNNNNNNNTTQNNSSTSDGINNSGAAIKQDIDNYPVLRQSSFNLIEVPEHAAASYESDPGTGKNSYEVRKKDRNISSFRQNTQSSSRRIGGILENKRSDPNTRTNPGIIPENRGFHHPPTDSESETTMPFGYTVHGIVVEYDDVSDWNQVLTDSIEVLAEICDTLLIDRRACLRLVSSKSSQFESLVDALSTFIQDNQTRDYLKRKEIEKRLKVLEIENKTLQEEMRLMNKTLLDKSEDALNLKTQLNRLESVVKSNRAEKVDKCVGTNDTSLTGLSVGGKTSKSKSPNQKGEERGERRHKTNHTSISHKYGKSPYAALEPATVNRTKLPSNTNAKNGYSSDRSESTINVVQNHDNGKIDTKVNQSSNKDTNETNTVPAAPSRQQSFTEISEEKLEKLKFRAKKLEDSLHDAISSMDTLNKSTSWLEKVRHCDKPIPMVHMHKVKATGNHHLTAKNIAYWKKSSFEVTRSLPNRHRFTVTVTHPALEINKKKHQPHPYPQPYPQPHPYPHPHLHTTLNPENSSLLEGRSIPVPHLDINTKDDPSNHISSLTMITDRSQGLTPKSTTSYLDGYHSEEDDRTSLPRHQNMNDPKNDLSARTELSHRVRARRGQVKQIVSKCLRCQKLFSPTDNHKLACCYHTKDKERLEHYDHMGMLVRVIYAWKCCNQPQEADGCSYGKHV